MSATCRCAATRCAPRRCRPSPRPTSTGAVRGARPAGRPSRRAADRRFRSANRWPGDLPGFREAIVGYCDTLERLVQRLVRLYAVALGLPPAYFARRSGTSSTSCARRTTRTSRPRPTTSSASPRTPTPASSPCWRPTRCPASSIRTQGGTWIDAPALPGAYGREWRAVAAALDQRFLPRHAARAAGENVRGAGAVPGDDRFWACSALYSPTSRNGAAIPAACRSRRRRWPPAAPSARTISAARSG